MFSDVKRSGEIEKTEKLIRLYEKLGIKKIRRLIFLADEAVYDKKYNENYHLKGLNTGAARAYGGNIRRFTRLHVISLAVTAVYAALRFTVYRRYALAAVDAVMCVVLVFDLMCLALQRYAGLKRKKVLMLEKVRTASEQ